MLNEDVLKEFIFECEMRRLSKRTIQSYRNANLRMMKYLEQEFHTTELEQTHHLAIRAYVQYQTAQGLAETYDRISKQKEPIVMIETFNDDEVKRLVCVFKGPRFLDVRNQLIMVMFFDTGMRNSEMCDLKMEDLRDTYIRVMGKGKKIRYLPITPFINKYLIRYLRVRESYIKDKLCYQTEYL